jgi:hypothetical protein
MLLANIFVVIGKWENVRKVREMLKDNGVEKESRTQLN